MREMACKRRKRKEELKKEGRIKRKKGNKGRKKETKKCFRLNS